MFTAHNCEAVGFLAESALEKSVKSSAAQTEILKNDEKESQVSETKHVQIQTSFNRKTNNVFADYDVDNLSEFLLRVTPYVCSILDKNSKSQAFENYELLLDCESSSIICSHVLERPTSIEVNCCCVAWNSVGTSIVAAYSKNKHESWCDHDGSIGIWSLSRRNFDPKKPNLILETDCCITYVAFHPIIPALLVAGKFNGEIMLWNISKEDDPLLGSSESSANTHREPITGLFWMPESVSYESIQFISCSLDGKILMWKLIKEELIPFDGFIILSNQLPRNFQIKSTKENSEVGILSMSVNHEDQSIFILGTEGGGILQGSFSSLISASYSGISSIPLKNPLTMCFERHKGQVTNVQFSKFSRNIFLSSGSDGELRISTLLQAKPVIVLLDPNSGINSAEWSLVRPMVLTTISSNGQLHIWDLMVNSQLPIESVYVNSENVSGMFLRQNHENKNQMATSTFDGKIQIWQLPGTAMKPQMDELEQFQKLSKITE